MVYTYPEIIKILDFKTVNNEVRINPDLYDIFFTKYYNNIRVDVCKCRDGIYKIYIKENYNNLTKSKSEIRKFNYKFSDFLLEIKKIFKNEFRNIFINNLLNNIDT